MAFGKVNLKKSIKLMAPGRLPELFRFRGGALDRLLEEDRVLQCQVRRLLKESPSNLFVKTGSD